MTQRERTPAAVLPGFEHIRRYWHPEHRAHVAKILPGEYYVTAGDDWILTVLGSCVSACIRDPILKVGGMNHFMLPDKGPQERWKQTDVDSAYRYGAYAMEHMINDLLKSGARRNRLEVKLAGGGHVLENMSDIGARNIEFVRGYLRREGFRVAGEDLGGAHPRNVHYHVATGRMRVRKLTGTDRLAVASEERSYRRSIDIQPVAGDVELF